MNKEIHWRWLIWLVWLGTLIHTWTLLGLIHVWWLLRPIQLRCLAVRQILFNCRKSRQNHLLIVLNYLNQSRLRSPIREQYVRKAM